MDKPFITFDLPTQAIVDDFMWIADTVQKDCFTNLTSLFIWPKIAHSHEAINFSKRLDRCL